MSIFRNWSIRGTLKEFNKTLLTDTVQQLIEWLDHYWTVCSEEHLQIKWRGLGVDHLWSWLMSRVSTWAYLFQNLKFSTGGERICSVMVEADHEQQQRCCVRTSILSMCNRSERLGGGQISRETLLLMIHYLHLLTYSTTPLVFRYIKTFFLLTRLPFIFISQCGHRWMDEMKLHQISL